MKEMKEYYQKLKFYKKRIYNVLGSDKYERPYNQFLNE
jgi:hypothetical protein